MKERIKTCAGCVELHMDIIDGELQCICPLTREWENVLLKDTKRCGEFEYDADSLSRLVKEMRNAQKAYFKSKDRDILIQSKILEQYVDDCISEE